MENRTSSPVFESAQAVLSGNDRQQWTIPAANLYPHQWLWDSCFVAIGLRHLDIDRAQQELLHLIGAQWSNGMIPHMVLDTSHNYKRDRQLWRSYVNPFSPDHIATSGITQPPMLAEAVIRIGKKLSLPERRSWYQKMYPALVRYHEWLYTDRDPHKEGLVVAIHPYESGLDNTPPWIISLRQHSMPLWIRAIETLRLEPVVNLVRRDTRNIAPGQRMSTIEAMAYFAAIRRLRRKAYNTDAILSRSLFAIEDLTFNCIAIRANHQLAAIAKTIGRQLPEELQNSMQQAENALDQLWDDSSGQYFSRNFVTHKLVREPTIATLLPLYAGTISKERAKHLVYTLLSDNRQYNVEYPIPSVPVNSSYFEAEKYWQGPTWINMNWLIADGLERYGYKDEAENLRLVSIEMVRKSGMYEYFNPLNGRPAGAKGFSWTAALTIDMLEATKKD